MYKVQVKHPQSNIVGAILAERAGHTADTDRAVRQGVQRVEQVSSAWSRGRQVHARRRDLKLSVRIRVLKAIVKGVLFTFVRTRAWQASQIHRLQSVINLAVRRAFNMRTYTLRHQGLSNAVLCRMVQWEPCMVSARRASLLWLGHVARMSVDAPQKQLLFGWDYRCWGQTTLSIQTGSMVERMYPTSQHIRNRLVPLSARSDQMAQSCYGCVP